MKESRFQFSGALVAVRSGSRSRLIAGDEEPLENPRAEQNHAADRGEVDLDDAEAENPGAQ